MAIQCEISQDVAVLRMDDGKANALSPGVLQALDEALDRAEADARAVVLAGRPGRFSGGFDLSVMGGGSDAMRQLVGDGARLGLRLFEFPRPVVAACTGHAVAMGAILLLCADRRVGAAGPFKIGLNEVAIGMPLPGFAVELAQERLSRRHLQRAAQLAEFYDPEGAVGAGFLDSAVDPDAVLDASLTTARALGGLPTEAFTATRKQLRGPAAARVRAEIERQFG